MLKVEGSNPGASILKFGLFQFSKWLCLDKTMAMQFSFKYCIDPKDHKSEEEIKSIAVEGAMRPKLSQEAMQDRGVPSEHCNTAALFVDNAFMSLIKMEMYVNDNK